MMAPLIVLLTAMTDVDWMVSPSAVDQGIPFEIQIRLQGDGTSVPDLEIPTLVVDGLDVLDGPSVFFGTDGKMVNSSYRQVWVGAVKWTVVADSAGIYQLPEIIVNGSDHDFKVNARSVVVRELKPSPDVFVELRCSNLTPWVDQVVDFELTVLIRPFLDDDLGVRIGSRDLVNGIWGGQVLGIDWDRSVLGPFSGLIQSRAQPKFVYGRGKQQGWEGYRWTVSKRFSSPGISKVEPVRLVGTYPASLDRTNSGRWSRIRIARRSRIGVETSPLQIQIQPPPQDGQPDDWVGAVGRFEMSSSLDRVTLSVGEPVTLTLKVEDLDGNADLARLPDPPFEQQLEQAGWKLSPDPAPGKVVGRVRTIRRSIRPTARAYELPSLRLPYFDAESSVWGVTEADAIPVQVTPVSQLAIEELQGPLVESTESLLEVGPETWPSLAQVNTVPSVTLLPVAGGFGLGLVAAGAIRLTPLLFSRREVSRKRKLDRLLRTLERAQGHVEVGQAARNYLTVWSDHASDPFTVLEEVDPQLAIDLQEAFVELDQADFGGGSVDASERVVGLLRRLPGTRS